MSFYRKVSNEAMPGAYTPPARSDEGAVLIYRGLWIALVLAPVLCCGCALAGYWLWLR